MPDSRIKMDRTKRSCFMHPVVLKSGYGWPTRRDRNISSDDETNIPDAMVSEDASGFISKRQSDIKGRLSLEV